MKITNFFARDHSLGIGLTLPILTVLVLALSVYLPGAFIKPKVSFLYSVGSSYCGQYKILDERLVFDTYGYAYPEASMSVAPPTDLPCKAAPLPLGAAESSSAVDVSGAVSAPVTVSGATSSALYPIQQNEVLYIYSPETNQAKSVSLADAQVNTYSSDVESSDGFTVRGGTYSPEVLPTIGMFFGTGGYSNSYSKFYLSGHGASKEIKLAGVDSSSYYNFRFLGWVK